ncbi:MAG: hypothetical protein ABI868_21985 [Acidobacteriota bacterium]
MRNNIVRALVMSGIVAVVVGTSTQAVRAAGHGEAADRRHGQVRMTLSGSFVPTAIEIQPDTITDEELLAGNGTLGPFTFRKLRTDELTPQSFGSCGSGAGPSIRVVAGAGVFRFEDGSLLTVTVTEGVLCVDLDHGIGHLAETYEITGGTGRFNGATGTFQSTGTLAAVLFSASGAASLLTSTGELKGTVRVP